MINEAYSNKYNSLFQIVGVVTPVALEQSMAGVAYPSLVPDPASLHPTVPIGPESLWQWAPLGASRLLAPGPRFTNHAPEDQGVPPTPSLPLPL